MTADRDVTDLLSDIQAGDHDAVDRLLPLVYDELRRLAHGALRGERADHTLGTTGLIHEAYLRLVDQSRTTWNGRAHFLGIAALAMRRTLVDYARRQKRLKRGGERRPVPIEDVILLADQRADSILELDDALSRLAGLNERLARVVECRFFGGLTVEETAEALQVTTRTVERDWQKARLWLYDQLRQ